MSDGVLIAIVTTAGLVIVAVIAKIGKKQNGEKTSWFRRFIDCFKK